MRDDLLFDKVNIDVLWLGFIFLFRVLIFAAFSSWISFKAAFSFEKVLFTTFTGWLCCATIVWLDLFFILLMMNIKLLE